MASSKRNSKHRKRSQRSKKIAVVGAATMTTAALTVGMAPPAPATAKTSNARVALAASPDYTQIIENSSDTLNNLLYAQANFTNALGLALNPLSALTLGVLPAIGAEVDQEDLTTTQGLINALVQVLERLTDLPDVSAIPGMPANANELLLENLGPLLTVVQGLPLTDVLGLLTGVPALLDEVVEDLNGINPILTGVLGPVLSAVALATLGLVDIPVPQVTVPSINGLLEDLLDVLGADVTLTSLESTFNWPILGVDGVTNYDNLFAHIPGLTVADLSGALLGELVVPNLTNVLAPLNEVPLIGTILAGLGITGGLNGLISGIDLPGLVDDALSPLDDLVETPSITAWIPTSTGDYTLPLGGRFGWLSTMPTVALGSTTVAGIEVPGSDTVVAIPVNAFGVNLPLNLASFAQLSTPGLVLPTATGVSTVGGTELQSFAIPLLGLSYTSLNTLNAKYIGTNGINLNSGQTVALLTTPFGPLPLTYSLGRLNLGTQGFGFTGPSIAGVGLLPSIQIGQAPVNQSPDGLLPAAVLNAGINTPTQLVSIIPSFQPVLDATINPFYNATFGALGAEVTEFLNGAAGPFADGVSDFNLRVSEFVRELSERLPGATQMPQDDDEAAGTNLLQAKQVEEKDAESKPAPQNLSSTKPAADGVKTPPTADVPTANEQVQTADELADGEKEPKTATVKTRTPLSTSVKNARAQNEKNFKEAQDRLDRIASNGRKQIKNTVDGVRKGVEDSAKQVRKDLKKAGDDARSALGGKKKAGNDSQDSDKGTKPAKSEKAAS